MAEKIQVSRIQNRRGLRRDLPQPLYAGEFGYCVDTGQLFIGSSSNYLEEIILGSELFQPAPSNGVTIANNHKNRVFFCDTYHFTKDAVSPDDIIVALEEQIYKRTVYDPNNPNNEPGTDYRDANLGERDFARTVKYQVLEDDAETGIAKWRFEIGVYMTEVEGEDGNRSPIDASIVRSNIAMAQVDNEIGEKTPIFTTDEYNVATIGVDYSPLTSKLTNAEFNGVKLTVDEYSALSWCINQIYILEDEATPGLVTVIGNVELVTEISLTELLPRDFRDTFYFSTEVDLSATGDAVVNGLELSLGLENVGATLYRSYDVDYSLLYIVNVAGEKERYAATGNMRISVIYDNSTPSLSFTDTFTQTTPPSGEFAWLPYLEKVDDAADVIRFKYKNTIIDNSEVVGDEGDITQPYVTSSSMEMRVFSVQWANF